MPPYHSKINVKQSYPFMDLIITYYIIGKKNLQVHLFLSFPTITHKIQKLYYHDQ